MARLVIFDDRMRGIDLPDHAVVIGRSQKVDIPIHDSILSRKHCSIVPPSDVESGGDANAGAGERGGPYRLLDLKSQNGTFVNGEQVEKSVLEFDDIIEIGNTVLVFLDTETWERGEGLTRLRNPVKAQELVQRINRREPLDAATVIPEPSVPDPRQAGVRVKTQSLEAQALTRLVLHEYAKQLLQSRPGLRARIARGVRALGDDVKDFEDLRDAAACLVEQCLEAEAAEADAANERGDNASS